MAQPQFIFLDEAIKRRRSDSHRPQSQQRRAATGRKSNSNSNDKYELSQAEKTGGPGQNVREREINRKSEDLCRSKGRERLSILYEHQERTLQLSDAAQGDSPGHGVPMECPYESASKVKIKARREDLVARPDHSRRRALARPYPSWSPPGHLAKTKKGGLWTMDCGLWTRSSDLFVEDATIQDVGQKLSAVRSSLELV
ncbi:hypothetical protein O1611_g1231 [Lasiodiplodia mahajangana]|uniref:Uncharacterized protein n=1 Tax=Lasiodiplodia mahajangana TaxID=1108764 RepID=A0ACC2JYL2_9PEZI|nr:hypothetical protein O1611_g1231 [Lasiodiplodia mahajangana]